MPIRHVCANIIQGWSEAYMGIMILVSVWGGSDIWQEILTAITTIAGTAQA